MSAVDPSGASLSLGEHLGQGAVATVRRVHGPGGRVYAGKLLHESHERDAASRARFAQEAELLEGLSHPNLVGFHGLVDIEGRRVLLMELVEGPTLAEVIARETTLDPARVQQLGRGLAAGLAYAHRAGIVHRDLKPSNVLLAGGTEPKIADFGMARATSLSGVGSQGLTVLGTPDYMAPECLDPLAVDARTDLYALGCILFEMLAGRPPFSSATPLGLLKAHRDHDVPALPTSVPAPLRTLVTSLLAKTPGDRPQAAESVRDALDAMLDPSSDAAGSTALAVASSAAPPTVARGRCVACGAPLVTALGQCIDCGHEIAHLEAGRWSVLVTGPGEPGDKLDATLRERLRQWFEDNPELGLEPADNLVKKIPRVPFPITTKVSERSGASLVRALQRLGLEATAVRGGPMAYKPMRAKSRTLMGRMALIMTSFMSGLWQTGWAAGIVMVGLFVAAGVMVANANRRVTRQLANNRQPLPEPVRKALEQTREALPAIQERRHRQGLRAVLTRVVDLARDTASDDPEAAQELVQAVNAAVAAAARLDALDRELAAMDQDSATQHARATLHARDTWASRLLSLTATLDTLASRRAAAGARRGLADDEETLDQLRAHVEALEEVQNA
ncbi:MAG: serine/threonine-protein kinase [Myxococcota bacterium]